MLQVFIGQNEANCRFSGQCRGRACAPVPFVASFAQMFAKLLFRK